MAAATPRQADISEFLKRAKAGKCSCPLTGTAIGFCKRDIKFFCQTCLSDHLTHSEDTKLLGNVVKAKDFIADFFLQPSCPIHQDNNFGFFCEDERKWKCGECAHSDCIKNKHRLEPFTSVHQESIKSIEEIETRLLKSLRGLQQVTDQQLAKIDEEYETYIARIREEKERVKAEVVAKLTELPSDDDLLEKWKTQKEKLETLTHEQLVIEVTSKEFKAAWTESESSPLVSRISEFLQGSPIISKESFPETEPKLDWSVFSWLASLAKVENYGENCFCIQRHSNELLSYNPVTRDRKTVCKVPYGDIFWAIPSVTLGMEWDPRAKEFQKEKRVLYVSGGNEQNPTTKRYNVMHKFNLERCEWTKLAKIPLETKTGISHHGFTVSPDQRYLYVVGGYDGKSVLKGTYRYSVCDDQWKELSPLPKVGVYLNALFCLTPSRARGKQTAPSSGYFLVSFGSADWKGVPCYVMNLGLKEYKSTFPLNSWKKAKVSGEEFHPEPKRRFYQYIGGTPERAVVMTNEYGTYAVTFKDGFHVTKLSTNYDSSKGRFCFSAGFTQTEGTLVALGDEGSVTEVYPFETPSFPLLSPDQ